eukprot:COSAG02_NODE_198_length_29564_cov_12.279009_29_plen_378_part_00
MAVLHGCWDVRLGCWDPNMSTAAGVPDKALVYPTPPPSREVDQSGASPNVVAYDKPPPSRQTLPDSVIDEMFAIASKNNPALGTFAELPDQALLNVLLTLAQTSDNVKEAIERQLATRERLKLLLPAEGAAAILARVQCPRGARFVERFACLRAVDVKGSHDLGDAGFVSLARALPPGLVELSIAGTQCSDKGIAAVAGALPRTRLKAFNCSDNISIGLAGWTALGEVLPSLPLLRTLSCSSCGVMNRSAKEPHDRWVERCSRDKVGMGDDGCIALANGLAGAVQLESVYLDTCGIGNRGACVLASVMPDCPSLHRLFVFCNPIGTEGREAFTAALPKCPKLTDTFKDKFSFEGTAFTLPKDQFYRDDGSPAPQVVL